jgi:hypothetical protein
MKIPALVPAPQLNVVRYFGALGASAVLRSLLILPEPAADGAMPSLCTHDKNRVSAKKVSSRITKLNAESMLKMGRGRTLINTGMRSTMLFRVRGCGI